MKTIRSLTTMLGLFLALYALGAAGTRAQAIYSTQFVGKFTLPFATQWGTMTLPPGDYTLEYGARETGHRVVNVQGTAKGSPHGMILAGPGGGTSETKNAIICIRYGNSMFVRALEMPAIGQAVTFTMPRSTRLVANHRSRNRYTQLAEAPVLIERIPVTLNAK